MIVVLGRPALDERGALGGLPARVAAAAAAAGARVEMVGTVADSADGDNTVVQLGRAGVGHAALLRNPGEARTLEAADVDLALRYVPDSRVVVLAEPLDAAAARAVFDGAAYHGAELIIVRESGAAATSDVPAGATMLEQPDEDAGAFADLVGRYASGIDSGRPAADAWSDAIAATGWEHAPA